MSAVLTLGIIMKYRDVGMSAIILHILPINYVFISIGGMSEVLAYRLAIMK